MIHYLLFYKSSLGEIGKHCRLKICSLWVVGSSPTASILFTKVAELVDALGLGSSSVKSRGSSPLFGINLGGIAQLVERMFCKYEVIGSNPIISKLSLG